MNNYFKMLFFSTVFLFCFLNAKNVLKIRKMWRKKKIMCIYKHLT